MEEGVLVSDSIEKSEPFDPKKRLSVCSRCPLFEKDINVCSPRLWMDPKTLDTSHVSKPGYKKGCGCLVTRKAYQPHAKCPLDLW